MITPSLLQQAAPELQGSALDDVLFDLFEEMHQNRVPQPDRLTMWNRLDQDPRAAEEFARYLRGKLGPQGNQPTLELRQRLRDQYFRDRLDRLAGIWRDALAEREPGAAQD